MAVKDNGIGLRLMRLARSLLHPAVLLHPFRMLHYWGYAHVLPLREVTKGRDLRIAPNASFRNGSRITDQAMVERDVEIGANAVVTKDVPAGAIAGGVPARVLRMRDGSPIPAPPGAASRPSA